MIKLKNILNESEESHKFSTDTKKSFLEIVSTYNKYQEMMDRKSDITKIAETLSAITDAAQQLAVNESDDWFDKHTVKRNMSELNKLGGQFSKIAKESSVLDQRMTGLYEDMGHILSRYYKIGEITEDEMKSRLGMTNEMVRGETYKVVGDGKTIYGDLKKSIALKLAAKKKGWKIVKESKLTEGADHILLQSIDMMIDSYQGHFISKDWDNLGGDIEFGTREWKQKAKGLKGSDKKTVTAVIKGMNE